LVERRAELATHVSAVARPVLGGEAHGVDAVVEDGDVVCRYRGIQREDLRARRLRDREDLPVRARRVLAALDREDRALIRTETIAERVQWAALGGDTCEIAA